MKLKPLGERVVIKKLEAKEKTDSGIILAGSAKEEPKLAEIIGISEEILSNDEIKNLVKIGDRVVFSEYAGNKVDLNGEEVIVIELENILAVVE